jgi:hypothetical protein
MGCQHWGVIFVSPSGVADTLAIARVENLRKLIFLKSQADFNVAHKNKHIQYTRFNYTFHFHIGKFQYMGFKGQCDENK